VRTLSSVHSANTSSAWRCTSVMALMLATDVEPLAMLPTRSNRPWSFLRRSCVMVIESLQHWIAASRSSGSNVASDLMAWMSEYPTE